MKQGKVLVGLSGGVDSSVSCALLKNSGYVVSAAFLRFWEVDGRSYRALADAKAICNFLKIPLEIVDARAEFKKNVLEYFLDEYARGRTPNPCIFCNERMKFGLLLETAKKMGIEMVATGHYARQSREFIDPNFQFQKKYTILTDKDDVENKVNYKLLEAKDGSKDQSYFLYRLKQEQLARIIFPLGEYEKTEVRKMAEKFRLPVFDKSDSQDVCFMANNGLEEFLKGKIELKRGKIVDTEGKILGEHRGLPLYTIGQRRGIEIGGTGPHFVVSKDMARNVLVVTNRLNYPGVAQKKIELSDVSWVGGIAPKLPLAVLARTRYHNPLVCAIIKNSDGQGACLVEFDVPQKAVSPGQSVVFYSKYGEILGGGVIE